MDALLKIAADAGLEVTTAEEALAEGNYEVAREALDRAADGLADLRARWAEMSPAERTVVGRVAAGVRQRLDATAARIPRRRVLSDAPVEVDPDQDRDPDEAA